MPPTHCETSGETKVLPAPVIVVVCCEAREAPAVPATAAARSAAAVTTASVRIEVPVFGIWFVSSLGYGQRTTGRVEGGIRACSDAVTEWLHTLRIGLTRGVPCVPEWRSTTRWTR